MNRGAAFAPRNADFEIWFGMLSDPSGRAFWFRYTILRKPIPVCVVWSVFFDPGRDHAVTQTRTFPLNQARFAADSAGVPGAFCSPDSAECSLAGIQWNLSLTHQFEAESHVPGWITKLPLVRTKSIVISPFGLWKGTVTVGGEPHLLQGRGTWTHIYGTCRVPELYWCFVPEFDDSNAGMELFSVRPRPGAPLLSFFTLREGSRLTHASLLKGFRAEQSTAFPAFAGRIAGAEIQCRMDLRAGAFIYVDPDASNRYVVQSDLSSAELHLPDGRRFSTRNRAAVEFHGMTAWPGFQFIDAYRHPADG